MLLNRLISIEMVYIRHVYPIDSGFIEYSEFVTVALERKKLMTHGTLQAAFNWIDLDGSGSIAADELMGVLIFAYHLTTIRCYLELRMTNG